MPKKETVLTPSPTKENCGRGKFEGTVNVFGNSIEVAGSAEGFGCQKMCE